MVSNYCWSTATRNAFVVQPFKEQAYSWSIGGGGRGYSQPSDTHDYVLYFQTWVLTVSCIHAWQACRGMLNSVHAYISGVNEVWRVGVKLYSAEIGPIRGPRSTPGKEVNMH